MLLDFFLYDAFIMLSAIIEIPSFIELNYIEHHRRNPDIVNVKFDTSCVTCNNIDELYRIAKRVQERKYEFIWFHSMPTSTGPKWIYFRIEIIDLQHMYTNP